MEGLYSLKEILLDKDYIYNLDLKDADFLFH